MFWRRILCHSCDSPDRVEVKGPERASQAVGAKQSALVKLNLAKEHVGVAHEADLCHLAHRSHVVAGREAQVDNVHNAAAMRRNGHDRRRDGHDAVVCRR